MATKQEVMEGLQLFTQLLGRYFDQPHHDLTDLQNVANDLDCIIDDATSAANELRCVHDNLLSSIEDLV